MNDTEAFFGVPAPLAAAMQKRGFTALSKVQRAVLDADGSTSNLRISSQTGSGKTVALGLVLADYFLALSEEEHRAKRSRGKDRAARPEAIIIAPTRELAAQVRGELEWLFAGMPQHPGLECVTGGTDVRGERRALAKGPRVLVATPGRLLDHMNSGAVSAENVAHVVLDEADQMLDMGFRDELDAIVEQLPEERRSHMVSATFPRDVLHLAHRFQGDALHLEGTVLGAANADIAHTAYLVRPEESYAALVNLLLLAQGQRCLVFVRRRADAAELAEQLAGDGFSALPFSGDLPQAQRTRTLNAFRAGIVNTLISTDVAARGIDVPDIATVIHAEPPQNADVYTHRSGRTGRAGRQGHSILLVPLRAQRRIDQLLRAAKVAVQWEPVPSAHKVRKTVVKQARTELHRRLDAEASPSETELAYAAALLEKQDPQVLVATLLDMATPKLPREPLDISPVAPRSGPTRTRRAEQFDTFETNWGSRQGATTARLLSHLCRRGNITNQDIGAIDIREDGATFGVASDVAGAFAAKASKKDPRDPHVRIRRVGTSSGPQRTARGPAAADRPRPPKRYGKKKAHRPGGGPPKHARKQGASRAS